MLIDKKLPISTVETLTTKAIDTSQRSYAVFKVLTSGVDDLDTFSMYTANNHKCQVFYRLRATFIDNTPSQENKGFFSQI